MTIKKMGIVMLLTAGIAFASEQTIGQRARTMAEDWHEKFTMTVRGAGGRDRVKCYKDHVLISATHASYSLAHSEIGIELLDAINKKLETQNALLAQLVAQDRSPLASTSAQAQFSVASAAADHKTAGEKTTTKQ